MEECCGGRRPSRSDVRLSVEQETKTQEETREYFDEIAPKRHTKPQRSEYSPNYVDALSTHSDSPEFAHFQRLQDDHKKLMKQGDRRNEVMEEEFVETEYYSDLNCVDKQHHTTGTGFIKMNNPNGNCFCLAPDTIPSCHASCTGNPATNDWIPAAPSHMATFAADKPHRSDN